MPTVRQQLIEERVREAQTQLGCNESKAFERFAFATLTGRSIHQFDSGDLVDGGQDKQIDIISITEKENGEAEILILSVKYTRSFSSNAIILMRNGLNWIFNKRREDLATISNTAFKDKIADVRSTLNGFGYSNVAIHCAFVNSGSSSDISVEFQEEVANLRQEYDNATFRSFSFEIVGAHELVDLLNNIERTSRQIDAEIPIKYDANNPSLIKYHSQGLKGLICTASARDIARIVLDDTSGAVFDANIRRFLGTRGGVNRDIVATSTNSATSFQFWFLNNGITIICDHLDPNTDPDNAFVRLRNLQIINGCQTASALANALESGELKADARVLLRIYETDDRELIDKIVLTTNNQNKISSRDLRANDQIQVDMEMAFGIFELWYERKLNQYRGRTIPPGVEIVPNELVGQCYLGIVLKHPADARRRKYKVWSEFYDQIFTGRQVEPHVLSVRILLAVQQRIEALGLDSNDNELRRKLAKGGVIHISRIVACMLRETDEWSGSPSEMRDSIEMIKTQPSTVDQYLSPAIDLIASIFETNPVYHNDIDGALKSNAVERLITYQLHDRG